MRQVEPFRQVLSLLILPSVPKWKKGRDSEEWAHDTGFSKGYRKALIDVGANNELLQTLTEETE